VHYPPLSFYVPWDTLYYTRNILHRVRKHLSQTAVGTAFGALYQERLTHINLSSTYVGITDLNTKEWD